MPAIIAGAGALAGGLAAKSLGLGPQAVPAGGGIAGLTASKGSGKNGAGGVVQVDPTIPLQYFQQAASQYQSNAMQGLNYYQGAVTQAISSLQQGTSQANQTLSGLSQASSTALNQELRMMGLQPIQATSNSAAQLGDLSKNLQGLSPDQQAQLQGLQSQINQAQALQSLGFYRRSRQQSGKSKNIGTKIG